MAVCRRGAQHRYARLRRIVLLAVLGGSGLWGCSVQTSRLLAAAGEVESGGGTAGAAGRGGAGGAGGTADALAAGGSTGTNSGNAGGSTTLEPDVLTDPPEAAVAAAIDERPIGGASLNGGTTGGGDYVTAFNAKHIYLVDTVAELQNRVSGDEPAVVLVAEGDYAFVGTTSSRATCVQACNPTTPLAEQTTLSGYCVNGETITSTDFDFDSLEVGSNKTIIGLGLGARLTNVEVDLSGSTNIILRNLSITDVSPQIAQLGYGLKLWPSDHVWLDHLTLGNIGHGYITIVSEYDGDLQVVTAETGYITLTNNHFNGFVEGVCGQRSSLVVGSHRNPALTFGLNWFEGSRHLNPYLFGTGTWGHVFNNLWTDIDNTGLAVSCGAVGIAQGNAFESTSSALYVGDEGSGTWLFCSTGYYGSLYAPMGTGTDEENTLDASSALNLHGQPTDGTGLTLPVRQSGNRWSVTAPVGTAGTESYLYDLLASPNEVSAYVQAHAGVGKLF